MLTLDAIMKNYRTTGKLSWDEIVWCLALDGEEEQQRLFALADRVRSEYLGDQVHLRAIIEFSNHCVRDCAYCGINRRNERSHRYRMEPGEIEAAAEEAAAMGFKTVILQSGEDFFYTRGMIAGMVRSLKKIGLAVTLSVGERPVMDYAAWKEAGADRYLLKFETSDPELYSRLHTGGSLGRRLECLRALRHLGYQTGSGNIVGLPGQTLKSLTSDLLLMELLHLDMAGIGPFLPHPATPLAAEAPGDFRLCLKVLAVARLLLPRTHLPSTTALGSVRADGRRQGLTAGANVVMLNLTPEKYRRFYDIYPAKAEVTATPEELKAGTERLIHELGREVSTSFGHSMLSTALREAGSRAQN